MPKNTHRALSLPVHPTVEPDADWRTATLGMGCFWSPEALFGQLKGVIRTRTGYAGGNSNQPTYAQMGDHTEMVQVVYDPGQITYGQLLEVFWDNHRPANINGYKGRQYHSLLLTHDEEQREAIRRAMEELAARGRDVSETEVAPFSVFYPAEERHQKYYLKRYPDALAKLTELYPQPDVRDSSTLAARLNGLAKGYTSLERIRRELEQWALSREELTLLAATLQKIRW